MNPETLVYAVDQECSDPYLAVVKWDKTKKTGKVQARMGRATDEDIRILEEDGLILLWRHGEFAFMARPQAAVEG